MAKEEVDRIFALVDVDNSGEIDFSEFISATVNRGSLLKEEKLQSAFKYFDLDSNGLISVEEIKKVLGVGKTISFEIWTEVVKEVDLNGDGEVSYEEFKEMMMKLLKE